MKNLKEKLKEIIENIDNSVPEDRCEQELIKYLYDKRGGKFRDLLLKIDELEKIKSDAERYTLKNGLFNAVNSFVSMSKKEKHKEIKEHIQYHFDNPDGNIAPLCSIAIALFPNGEKDTQNEPQKWFWEKFVKLLMDNRGQYQKGGSSFNWVERMEYENYINKIIEENS